MTRKGALNRGFFIGLMMALLSQLFFQDFMGLEAYVDTVRRHWINLPWWPWAAGFVVMAVVSFRQIRKARREDESSRSG